MIKRIAPAIDRRFEGRALMDGAAGSALVVGAMAIVLAALALVKSRVPGGLGALLLLVVVGAIIVAACLRYPPLAVVILLGAMFLRLALPHLIVADPFLIAYALAVVAAAVWMWQQRHALPRVTFVEVAMVLYTLWCYGSMVLPHQYPPVEFPLNGQLTARPSLHRAQRGHPVHDVPAGEAAVHPRVGGAVRVVVDPRLRRVLHAGEHLPVLRTEPRVAAVHRGRTSLAGPRGWRVQSAGRQWHGTDHRLRHRHRVGQRPWRANMATGPAVAVRADVHPGHLPHPHARDLPGLRACADPRRPPGAGSPRRIRRPDRRDHPRDRLELVDLHQL